MRLDTDPRRVRSYALKTFTREEGGQKRTITTFIASTDIEDRYQDVINQDTWRLDNYRKNPVVPVDHYYSVSAVVGRAVDLRVEEIEVEGKDGAKIKRKALLVDVEWDTDSDLGREVAGKVERGFINAVSVGFRSHKLMARIRLPKDDPNYGTDGYLLEENELYEISVVAVPANPEAIAQRKFGKLGHDKDGSAVLRFTEDDIIDAITDAIVERMFDDGSWRKLTAKRLAAKAEASPPASADDDTVLPWLRGS